jgi:acetyl esterase/lipase
VTSDVGSAPRDLLDPEIAEAADLVPFDDLTADVLRRMRAVGAIEMPLSDAVERTDSIVPGDPELPVRVHRPKGFDGALACLYSMHGGGYVLGSNATDDVLFDELCPNLGVVGVSIDYRLAPETPYPEPLEDCYRGLRWTSDHAADLGVDADCIGVRGVSAGGGLAAALALLVRDRGDMSVRFQLLESPMLDDRQITPSSRQDGLPVWSRSSNSFGWRSYLGDLYGRDDVPATAAPARATDLTGLPPAFVSVGAVDGFRDEDVDYALRLNQAGVPAELHVYPGACHGFFHLAPDSAVTQQCKRDMEDWLRRQLGVRR